MTAIVANEIISFRVSHALKEKLEKFVEVIYKQLLFKKGRQLANPFFSCC